MKNKNLKWYIYKYDAVPSVVDIVANIILSRNFLSSSHIFWCISVCFFSSFGQCRITGRSGGETKNQKNPLHGKGSKSLRSLRRGNRIKANETTSEQLYSIWKRKRRGAENWKVGRHHTTPRETIVYKNQVKIHARRRVEPLGHLGKIYTTFDFVFFQPCSLVVAGAPPFFSPTTL